MSNFFNKIKNSFRGPPTIWRYRGFLYHPEKIEYTDGKVQAQHEIWRIEDFSKGYLPPFAIIRPPIRPFFPSYRRIEETYLSEEVFKDFVDRNFDALKLASEEGKNWTEMPWFDLHPN